MDEILGSIDIYAGYAIVYNQLGELYSAKAFSMFRKPMIMNGIGYFAEKSEARMNMEAAIDVIAEKHEYPEEQEQYFEIFLNVVRNLLKLKPGESFNLSNLPDLRNMVSYDFEKSKFYHLLQDFADEMGYEIEQNETGNYELMKLDYS